MSAGPSVCLDHVGFIVRDLDATCDFLARLGFTLTLRADHTRTDEAGDLVSAGSSQRSIMLSNGYLELMQITDPQAGHQLAAAPSVRHGLHIVAFGTDDAAECRDTCVGTGLKAGPVMHWSRPVNEAGLQGTARFSYFGAEWSALDPSYLCWVEHLTPGLMRSPQLLRHENGAAALTGIHYRGPRLQAEAWIARLRAAGANLASERGESALLSLPNALVRVDFDENLPAVFPRALVLEFSDLAWLRARCRERGVHFGERARGTLDLDLAQELGLHWICRPAPPRTSSGTSLP